MSATQAPIGEVIAVRPGDTAAASEVDGWLCDYAASRDPALRERIILAYLGLADRLADRYRTSRGDSPWVLTLLYTSSRGGRMLVDLP
jgi:hypothetical protein